MAPFGNKNAEKKIDWDKVDQLCKINASQMEIADVLDVDVETLCSHCVKEKGIVFSAYLEKKRNIYYKIGIKRALMQRAMGIPKMAPKYDKDGNIIGEKQVGWHEKPDVTLLIFLSKASLGYNDNPLPQLPAGMTPKTPEEMAEDMIARTCPPPPSSSSNIDNTNAQEKEIDGEVRKSVECREVNGIVC